jgi:hypothetical protein
MAKKGKGNKINKIEKSIEETKKQEIIEIETPIEEKNLLTEEEIKDEPIIENEPEVQPEPNFDISQEITIENNSIFDEQAVIDELPKIELVNEPIEIKIAVKPKRTVESLGKDELRYYQRTGKLPE